MIFGKAVESDVTKIHVNFNETIGKIKPMHAIGQPPLYGVDCSYLTYLKEANIPYSRLHDVGGAYGCNRYVDIPNIFRDFDADENDPASYDFAFTDFLIRELMWKDCTPIFRLGVSIENAYLIRAYRIHPPKDFDKWARICEHIIRHYNEGWADGFQYGIAYWEIWNEPENNLHGTNPMWTGTDEQFFELYGITAKHLKACFGDTIKVGGYGATSFANIFDEPEKYGLKLEKRNSTETELVRFRYTTEFMFKFFDYIKENNVPVDFFSWHSYYSVKKSEILSDFLENVIRDYGFEDMEILLDEWNNAHEKKLRGTSYAAANAAAMMLSFQNRKANILCYYDATFSISVYAGMFHPVTYEPFCLYYAFKAFGHLYSLGKQVKCDCDADELYVVGATDGAGKNAIMIANIDRQAKNIAFDLDSGYKVWLIDENHAMTETELSPSSFVLEPDQVALIKN